MPAPVPYYYLRGRRRLRSTFPALRHRNFRLFIAGQFVSLSGTWMQTVAHGWLVLTLTNSPFVVGLVSTLGSLPILLFTLYGGVLADRVNKQKFITILQCFMLCEALTLAILTQFGWVTVPWVVALAIFFGLLTAFEVPARQAFVVDLVGKEHLMNAIALNSTAFNVSRVIGPALAGGLIATFGVAAAFFANAASYVGVIAGLLAMRWPEGGPPRAPGGLDVSMRAGFDYVLGERWPRAIILLTAVFAVFGFSFITMLPVLARDALRVGASGYGALVSSVGFGAAVGAVIFAGVGVRVRQERVALEAGMLFGVLLIAVAAVPAFWASIALLTVAGCAMAVHSIAANTYLQHSAPDNLRGRVMGFYSFVALGMAPFGTLQAGWVAEHFGIRASFALGGLFCALAAVVLRWGMRKR